MAYHFATIIPVDPIAAETWAHGQIGDYDLIETARRDPPWSIYCANLPCRAAWRTLPPQMRALAPGALTLIVRTQNPVVMRWLAAYDVELVTEDPDGCGRFWASPESTADFLRRYVC